jgi:signal transduction histidine kinase/HAMP domain-containing protein
VRVELRHRIVLLVLLAAAALLSVTIVALVLGRQSERQLQSIETRYVPLLELDRDLKRTFSEIVRTLENAAGAGESDLLADADRASAELLERIAKAQQAIVDNGGDPRALSDAFRSYYAAAREVSASMIQGTQPALLEDKIAVMNKARGDVTALLETATRPDRTKLAAAFAAARASQRESLRVDLAVAGAALVLMTLLSWRLIRRIVRSLRAVSDGVERLAEGDFSKEIDVRAHDEVGDLARRANRTAERLRDYREQSDREAWIKGGVSELANKIAGDLAVTTLATQALSCLASYIGATSGAVYASDGAKEFRRIGVLGEMPNASETLALDDELAANELGIADAEVMVPLTHESRVLGVLVLALREPSEHVLELLRRSRGLLGIALEVAQAHEHARQLLVEARRHALATEVANRELEAFSYSVSHDLRAPLRAIDGFGQMLLEDEAAQLTSEGQHHLNRIRAATQRMGELIDDLLRLARMSRVELRRQSVDLSAIGAEVIGELRQREPEREVSVVVQEGVVAVGDARLIRITLENLLGNAWKFTTKTERARIELGARDDDGRRVYFVRDNGAGFDMKHVERLFGAFQRLHTEQEFPGTGIGLATVKRIVYRHGGQIWVHAEPGNGAEFQFTLPA